MRCNYCGRFLSEDDFDYRNKKKKLKYNMCKKCRYNYNKLYLETKPMKSDAAAEKLIKKVTGRDIKIDMMIRSVYQAIPKYQFVEYLEMKEKIRYRTCNICGKDKITRDFIDESHKECLACYLKK